MSGFWHTHELVCMWSSRFQRDIKRDKRHTYLTCKIKVMINFPGESLSMCIIWLMHGSESVFQWQIHHTVKNPRHPCLCGELNPGPPEYKSGAVTTELHSLSMIKPVVSVHHGFPFRSLIRFVINYNIVHAMFTGNLPIQREEMQDHLTSDHNHHSIWEIDIYQDLEQGYVYCITLCVNCACSVLDLNCVCSVLYLTFFFN